MLWIILVTIFSAVAARPYIITPPNDVIGKLGGVAEFKCEVDEPTIPELTWEFNQDTIYSLQYGEEDYPMGTDKYSVEKNGRNFILKISNLLHSDGGRYTCRTLKQAEDAHLIVKEVAKSIITPPKDAIGKLGRTAQFKCVVEFEDIPVLTWEFNGNVIYSLQFYNEQYPMGRAKYFVTQDEKNFVLTVNDLQYEDGGKYACRVLAQVEEANLIVRDTQIISSSRSNPVEGSTLEYICTVQFAGPSKNDISPEHFPQLRMTIDRKRVSEEFNEQELEGPTTFYKLMQTFNITLEAKMHGSTLLCEIIATDPVLQVNVTKKVEVLYSVRQISYNPISAQYNVGSAINCTADGNPQPRFVWADRDTERSIHGQSLTITKQMVGENIWRCTANNTVHGNTHQERVVAVFKVVQSEEVAVSSTESGIEPWQIGVPVAIAICLILIACLIAFVKRREKLDAQRAKEDCEIEALMPDSEQQRAAETRNAQLVNIIASLGHKEDLTYEVDERLRKLLPDEAFPVDAPSALVLFIYKSKYLMESDNYHTLLQKMVTIYKRNQWERKEDPLLALVELLENEPSMMQNHDKLKSLLKIIMPLHSSTKTRSMCMRSLITKTREWVIFEEEKLPDKNRTLISNPLQWTNDLIEIFKDLLKGQGEEADPAWSPKNSPEGSILHMFMRVVVQVVINKPDLFENILELLEMMMTDSAVSFDNVDGDGKTVLHSLVTGMKVYLTAVPPCDISKIILQVKAKNSELLDVKDKLDCAPLHSFINTALPVDRYDLSKELLQLTTKIILLLKSDKNVSFKVSNSSNIPHTNSKGDSALHCIISTGVYNSHQDLLLEVIEHLKPTNIDFQNDKKETALHLFIENVADWLHKSDNFVVVIEILKSEKTLEIKNASGNTPLHAFTSTVGEWTNHPEEFLNVVRILKSETNVDIKNIKGETPLHIFISNENEWEDNPKEFLDVIKCLKTSVNIEHQNAEGATALHIFASKACDWRYHTENIVQILNCLKSSNNINLTTKLGETALHLLTLKAGEWKDHKTTFFKVAGSLQSSQNINSKNNNGETALHVFTSIADEWRYYPDKILEVINNLKSERNINIETNTGETPLHICASKAGGWRDHPQEFLKILKSLISPNNLDITNSFFETPLHIFTSKARPWRHNPKIFLQVVQCLISKTSIVSTNIMGATALHKFTSYVDVWKDCPEKFFEVVQTLKSQSPTSLDVQDKDGNTPLHSLFLSFINWRVPANRDMFIKIAKSYSETMKVDMEVIREREAQLTFSLKPKDGNFPESLLDFLAKFSTNTKIIEKTHDKREMLIFTSSRGKWGESTCHLFLELVKCLVSTENINIQDDNEDTPLHCFARCKSEWADHEDIVEIVKLLISQKNITMGNKNGETAMNLIEKNWADHDGLQKILDMASNEFGYVTNSKKTKT